MLFNSKQFMIFFPIVLAVNFTIPRKKRYLWLLAASYYFYMSWDARYALLLLFSTAITYAGGLALDGIKQMGSREKHAKLQKACIAACVGLNLLLLGFFKYYNFAARTVNRVLDALSSGIQAPILDIVLPVGISFYIFQSIGYLVDVYRGEVCAEKNFFIYALFVSFFPQLVAGPIERSGNLLGQLREPKGFCYDDMREGFLLMLWGFFLKIVIADRAAIFVDFVFGNYQSYNGWFIIAASCLFLVQIYCDFYGYSVIAMGVARMLGIQLMENFDAPFFAQTSAEFWHRWHISLNSWFRDYLYIPLGGNRKGRARKYANQMAVYLASGLWHGASWNYVAWGGILGLYQVAGDMLKPARRRLAELFRLDAGALGHKLLRIFVTFAMTVFAMIFFRANGIAEAADVIRSIFLGHNLWILFDGSLYGCGLDQKNFMLLLFAIAILLVADACKYKGICIRKAILRQEFWFRWLVAGVSLCFVLLFGIWGSMYSAANFIYFQF